MFNLSQHSLVVVMATHLRWLGLRSLKEVSAGKVLLKDNPQLCYTQPFQWTHLFRSADQAATIRNNKAAEECGKLVFEWKWRWSAMPSEKPMCCCYRAAEADVWPGVHRPGLLGSRSWHVCVLSPLQPRASLCATLQRAGWVRTPVSSRFYSLRALCGHEADLLDSVCPCLLQPTQRSWTKQHLCFVSLRVSATNRHPNLPRTGWFHLYSMDYRLTSD